jgi:hypothetical protein
MEMNIYLKYVLYSCILFSLSLSSFLVFSHSLSLSLSLLVLFYQETNGGGKTRFGTINKRLCLSVLFILIAFIIAALL